MKNNPENHGKKTAWIIIIIVLIVLGLMSVLIAGIIGMFLGISGPDESPAIGNVAVIAVEGQLLTSSTSSLTSKAAISSDIVKLIEKAAKDSGVKAIVLAVNSPGGSAVASDEISEAVRAAALKNKTTVAWIRDIGTSGAYWVASSTEHIIAHPASFTGSIGVISSYVEVDKLMNDYNVTYRRLVAGKYKDIGTPFKEMTPEEYAIFQQSLDEMHALFINKVAENRKLSPESVRAIATGQFYTGMKAKELGLVDELGGKKEVENYLKAKLKTDIKFAEFKKPKTFFERLADSFSEHGFQVGMGLAQGIKEENNIKVQI